MTISNENKTGVTWCHICEDNPQDKRRYKGDGLAEGKNCPICFAPTCRYHLSTVRWRWKKEGSLGADQICKECKRTYRYRSWDILNREWIS
jgi:hypothetical protein